LTVQSEPILERDRGPGGKPGCADHRYVTI